MSVEEPERTRVTGVDGVDRDAVDAGRALFLGVGLWGTGSA